MQLILVSGLSGSGKSIALHVLEDAGYYCVDNLPATLLLEVADFMTVSGQEKAAISVDARSAALASLPAHIEALKGRGVDFEHYDFPETKLEGDVHVSGKMRAAWFKDPDGNILAIVNNTEH